MNHSKTSRVRSLPSLSAAGVASCVGSHPFVVKAQLSAHMQIFAVWDRGSFGAGASRPAIRSRIHVCAARMLASGWRGIRDTSIRGSG
eukprot:2257070-Rhodomonas_salina.4